MMAEMKHGTVETNGIRMHYVEHGSGPLVVMCHGFPESWYSWRHQLEALGEAGFHAVAPDMRGYGNTDRPADIDQYTLLHLTGDVVGLLDALGAESAVIAGHDWGAPVAWLAALLRPDRFRGVIGLSVPYRPRGKVRPTTVMPQTDDAVFYQLYFQNPGVAEAEFEQDVRSTIRGALYWGSGDAPRQQDSDPAGLRFMVPRGGAGSRAGQTQRHSHPGSARPTWISTSGSSPAPGFAAVSTGTATSIATGSSWRSSPERE